MTLLALRVDVDTYDGLRVGVPRILALLRRLEIRATFFVAFGPERAGLAVGRAWQPSFAWKMVRNRALRTYGWRTVLSGTLLPARLVGESFGSLLGQAAAEGHELGLHGYDHFGWQRKIQQMSSGAIETAFRAGIDAFTRSIGHPPHAAAAPGWRMTAEALSVEARFGFRYASDTRGAFPFRARVQGTPYGTLQIPTTMPTMDELVGTVRDLSGALELSLRPGLNVFTAHAEMEGGWLLSEFERFLRHAQARGILIQRLGDVAEQFLSDIERVPVGGIERRWIRGRSGWVLAQEVI